ncbi:unnamed protein product, partial [Prorocentrum cordatum]
MRQPQRAPLEPCAAAGLLAGAFGALPSIGEDDVEVPAADGQLGPTAEARQLGLSMDDASAGASGSPRDSGAAAAGVPAPSGALFRCAICSTLVYESQLEYHVGVCPDPADPQHGAAPPEPLGAPADGFGGVQESERLRAAPEISTVAAEQAAGPLPDARVGAAREPVAVAAAAVATAAAAAGELMRRGASPDARPARCADGLAARQLGPAAAHTPRGAPAATAPQVRRSASAEAAARPRSARSAAVVSTALERDAEPSRSAHAGGQQPGPRRAWRSWE